MVLKSPIFRQIVYCFISFSLSFHKFQWAHLSFKIAVSLIQWRKGKTFLSHKTHIFFLSKVLFIRCCSFHKEIPLLCRVRVMVFNATFNNISAILWRSVLLVEEAGVPGENYRHGQTWSHNAVSSTPHHERDSNSKL